MHSHRVQLDGLCGTLKLLQITSHRDHTMTRQPRCHTATLPQDVRACVCVCVCVLCVVSVFLPKLTQRPQTITAQATVSAQNPEMNCGKEICI